MPQPPRNVEIIGGGLAGLALGLGLRARRIPVTIHEAGAYPRHRVCGEFITGLDAETRMTPGIAEALATARPARGVAWYEGDRVTARHSLPQAALCLSRHRLDRELAEAFVRSGGNLHLGSRRQAESRPGLVLACGRRADTSSPWIGRKEHFHGLELTDDLELHLGHRAYVGLTLIDDRTVNVCGLFPRPGAHRTMIAHIRECGLPGLAARLSAAQPVPGSSCAVAGLDYGAKPAAPGTIMLGDRRGLTLLHGPWNDHRPAERHNRGAAPCRMGRRHHGVGRNLRPRGTGPRSPVPAAHPLGPVAPSMVARSRTAARRSRPPTLRAAAT